MASVAPIVGHLRNPRGFHAAKVDSAGRLKLPAAVYDYLERLSDKALFVTLLQEKARIYTGGSFDANLAKLDAKPQLRAAMAIEADRYGDNANVDPQRRITLPQALRKALKVEDQTVYLRFYEDVIFVYTQEQYERVTDDAAALLEQQYDQAAELGFV